MKTTKMILPLAVALALGLAACSGDNGSERDTEAMADELGADVSQQEADNAGEQESADAPVASGGEAVAQTSSDLADAQYEGEADTIDTLLQAIRQEVGNPVANSRDECRVAGVGHRPCGGPERFLLYSVQTTDEAKLLPIIERYNSLVRQRVEDEGRVGTCQVLPEPGVIVRGGVCVAAEKAEM